MRRNINLDEATERCIRALSKRGGGFNLSDFVRKAIMNEYQQFVEFMLLVGECPICGAKLDGIFADGIPVPHTQVCPVCGREYNMMAKEVQHV